MKRAQTSQVFTYLMAVVVIGAIFVFGYMGISKIMTGADEISFQKFKLDLESDMEKIAQDWGTRDIKTYAVDSRITEVCFVRNYDTGDADYAESNFKDYPLIHSNLEISGSEVNVQNNVFLLNAKKQPVGTFSVADISFAEGVLKCFQTRNGRLSFNAEGTGSHVIIS